MNVPLFIDNTVEFEKTAMEAKLSDSADTWPQEVLQEAHKQHSYLGRFSVSPNMKEVDGERGYGIGFLEVRSKTNQPATTAGLALAAQAGAKYCKIPVIITDSMLKELDVFIDPKGKPHPLNEQRIREAMFRPELFDSTGSLPVSSYIGGELTPPGRSKTNLLGASEVTMPKVGSAKQQYLLDAIGPTISKEDIDRITLAMNENEKLASALLTNEATIPFIKYLSEVDPVSSEDIAKLAADSIPPDVLMMTVDDSGYRLKMANSQAFRPEVYDGDRLAMIKVAGEEMVEATDKHGVAVVHTDPVVRDNLEDERIEVVTQFGEYRVKDSDGKEHLGWVFPSVLDFDGTSLPIAVFTNGSVSSLQSTIAGSFVGKGTNIIRGAPKGHGFFYKVTDTGSAIAFVPCEIINTGEDEVGPYFMVKKLTGEEVKLRPVPGLKEVSEVREGEYGIPAELIWAPLGDTALKMMEDPSMIVKAAEVRSSKDRVSIISDGRVYSLRGDPLTKLASRDTELISPADALFMTCSLGIEPHAAMSSLVKAGQEGKAEINNCRPLVPYSTQLATKRKQASQMVDQLPSKHLLLKEAAGFNDMSTVDKVLSLGFLNAENVGTFVNYIPDFEEIIQKLAALLIASRIGLKDVPEMAAKNAMERLEEVTRGLKELVYRKVEA